MGTGWNIGVLNRLQCAKRLEIKMRPGENDPDYPSTLLNNEQIAFAESIVTKVPARLGEDVDQEITCYNCKLVKAEDTVI